MEEARGLPVRYQIDSCLFSINRAAVLSRKYPSAFPPPYRLSHKMTTAGQGGKAAAVIYAIGIVFRTMINILGTGISKFRMRAAEQKEQQKPF